MFSAASSIDVMPVTYNSGMVAELIRVVHPGKSVIGCLDMNPFGIIPKFEYSQRIIHVMPNVIRIKRSVTSSTWRGGVLPWF